MQQFLKVGERQSTMVRQWKGAVSPVDPTDIVINLLSEPDSLMELRGRSEIHLARRKSLQRTWRSIRSIGSKFNDRPLADLIPQGFVANGGDADIKGLEFELFGAVNDGLNIGFNATFQDAEIANATADQQAATGSSIGARLVSTKVQSSTFC
jgi:hypothetical protein